MRYDRFQEFGWLDFSSQVVTCWTKFNILFYTIIQVRFSFPQNNYAIIEFVDNKDNGYDVACMCMHVTNNYMVQYKY